LAEFSGRLESSEMLVLAPEPLSADHRARGALLEIAVADQLGVEAAVAGVVDLLQEFPELGRVDRRAVLRGVDRQRARTRHL
jgi:hypothetical protein